MCDSPVLKARVGSGRLEALLGRAELAGELPDALSEVSICGGAQRWLRRSVCSRRRGSCGFVDPVRAGRGVVVVAMGGIGEVGGAEA